MRLASFSLPVERLSATSLATALTCPNQFRMRYVQKQKEKPNIAKLVGTAFHEAVADNWRWKLDKGTDLAPEELGERFSGAWDASIEKEGEPEWKEPPVKLMEMGGMMLDVYLAKVMSQTTPIACEEWFEEWIPDIPVPVVGVIDLRLKDRIREVKTSATKMKVPKPNWRLQSRIYQLVMDLPVEHHVVTKQKTPQIVTAADEPGLMTTIQNKDATVLMLQQATALINDMFCRHGPDNPWPQSGFLHPFQCATCSFKKECVAWMK